MTRSSACSFLVALLIGVSAKVSAQDVPKITLVEGKAFIAAEIDIKGPIAPTSSKAFVSTPSLDGSSAKSYSARGVIEDGKEDQMWSAKEATYKSNARTFKYPLIGIANKMSVVAAETKITEALKPGNAITSDEYQIDVSRPIVAGEIVPTVEISTAQGNAILSIEPENQDKSEAQPFLRIFEQKVAPDQRAAILGVWRKANETVKIIHTLPEVSGSH